jgi:hypothetical protein
MSELQSTRSAPLTHSIAAQPATNPFPWWLQAIVLLGALLMAAGALIALLNPSMLVSPHDEINAAVHVYAGYLFSRNAALATLLVISMIVRARGILNILVLLTASIQLLDAGVDWHGRPMGHRAWSRCLWSAVLVGVRTPRWSSVLAERGLEPSPPMSPTPQRAGTPRPS